MAKRMPYGGGSKRDPKPVMGRDEVIEAMRYLGYITHDSEGKLTDEAAHVGRALAGQVKENVMLGVLIAQEVGKYREANK
jgi:hypothetical protein